MQRTGDKAGHGKETEEKKEREEGESEERRKASGGKASEQTNAIRERRRRDAHLVTNAGQVLPRGRLGDRHALAPLDLHVAHAARKRDARAGALQRAQPVFAVEHTATMATHGERTMSAGGRWCSGRTRASGRATPCGASGA